MLVKLTQSLTLVTILLSATGCQTVSMSAKSGTNADTVSNEGGVCARYKNERSNCDDQVGCSWDNAHGTCASH